MTQQDERARNRKKKTKLILTGPTEPYTRTTITNINLLKWIFKKYDKKYDTFQSLYSC